MSAAIRIDVHLHSIAATNDCPADVQAKVKSLAERLSAQVRQTLIAFAESLGDKTGNEAELVKAFTYPGLGPTESRKEPEGAQRLGDGLSEHLEDLAAGKDTHDFGPVKGYVDGAFHVVVKANLG